MFRVVDVEKYIESSCREPSIDSRIIKRSRKVSSYSDSLPEDNREHNKLFMKQTRTLQLCSLKVWIDLLTIQPPYYLI